MEPLDCQEKYWDSVADTKTFTHPIPWEVFSRMVSTDSEILDYGCGYGRTCQQLVDKGYQKTTGVDISSAMIECAKSLKLPTNFLHHKGYSLPFPDETFTACTLLAVLTCVISDIGQSEIINELKRVLKPGGVVLLSDYLIQCDPRNQERYHKWQSTYETFGVFELSDGGIVRHHHIDYLRKRMFPLDIVFEHTMAISTMNGNPAKIVQMIAKKPNRSISDEI